MDVEPRWLRIFMICIVIRLRVIASDFDHLHCHLHCDVLASLVRQLMTFTMLLIMIDSS